MVDEAVEADYPTSRLVQHQERWPGEGKVIFAACGDSGIGLEVAAVSAKREGSFIVNAASVTAYRGSPQLLGCSSTKSAVIAFTRPLAQQRAQKSVWVDAVAPGPIWTALIPSPFPAEETAILGHDTLMKRAGQPEEVASCYVFLASNHSSYISGQTLHPNGGEVVSG